MPVYNGEPYLAAAIEGIVTQTFQDFEFLILDDGSSDRTWDIATDYAQQDLRIRLLKNETNLGLVKTLNRGLAAATGQFIARQDADDISLPHRFATQIAAFQANPHWMLVSCNLELIDERGTILTTLVRDAEPWLVQWYLLFYNRLGGHSQVMFRREAALAVGGYLGSRPHNEDYELWSNLARKGAIAILPDVLLQYRVHSQSVSSANRSTQTLSSLTQTQLNLEALLNHPISLETAEALRGFWRIPETWNYGPKPHQVMGIHRHLKQLYATFLPYIMQQMQEEEGDRHRLSKTLRQAIAQQFLIWLDHLSLKRELGAKLAASYTALQWMPHLVVQYWWARLQITFKTLLPMPKSSGQPRPGSPSAE
jgi:hypothetical protein